MDAIYAHELTKVFGRNRALDQTSFSIGENTLTGLIGRNGAGKTTLLKTISGFIRRSAGELTVLAQDPFNSYFVSRNSIFIDDSLIFPDTLSLSGLLEEGAGFYPNWNEKLANSLANYFSLPLSRTHNKLSKGTKSTFNAIFGLAAGCELTLFDEPTTGMDASARKDFYRALLKEYLNRPRTIIVSSHLLNELEPVLEHIMLLHKGKIVFNRPLEELKEYGLTVKGHRQALQSLIPKELILQEELFGEEGLSLAIENKLPAGAETRLRAENAQIQPMAVQDLCIYLTQEQKGGIDEWL